METVDLIASGYEWVCPHCDGRGYHSIRHEIEVTPTVTCPACDITYEVRDFEHAVG